MLFDQLESRRMMSVSINVTSNGMLNVEGTFLNDNIAIYHSPSTNRYTVGWYDSRAMRYTTRTVAANGITHIRVAGHEGNDTISIDRSVKVWVSLNGDAGNDWLIQNGTNTGFLSGYAGDDTLWGGDGNDYLYGADGRDTLDGRRGADVMWGMAGYDTVTYANRSEALRIAADGLAVSGANNERDQIGTDVETLIGGSGPDLIYGTANMDALFGGPGNDTIKGFGGDDAIQGHDGNDVLDGGAGTDLIMGGSGNDVIEARDGAFRDVIYGNGYGIDGYDVAFIDRSLGVSDTVYDVDWF
jgi:Ca2+-binding RTX toxin-like protein